MFNKNFFKNYSLFTLVFTILTILWGAWVRISLSGDGCGKDWPLCKQSFLPSDSFALIEWLHRFTSGLSLLLILVLFLLSFKIYPAKHLVRKLSSAAFALIIVEALIGAVLVLSSLVALNTSHLRVFVLAFHLINSLILVATLALCWQASFWDKIKIKPRFFYFLLFFLFLALTGNIASLAGTLFPTKFLSQALALDFSPTAHITLKLRPLHPLLAVLFLISLGVFSFNKTSNSQNESSSFGKTNFKIFVFSFFQFKNFRNLNFKKHNLSFIVFFTLFAVLFGFATLISLSPVWMKLSHLLIAYTLWIGLVCASFESKRR